MTKLRNLKTLHIELILSVYMQLISLKKITKLLYCVTCKIRSTGYPHLLLKQCFQGNETPAFCACGIFAFEAEAKICSVEPPGLFRRI